MKVNKFVIVADGKYANIFYTGREDMYWSENIMKAHVYSNEEIARKRASKFKYNNARVAEIVLKEIPV